MLLRTILVPARAFFWFLIRGRDAEALHVLRIGRRALGAWWQYRRTRVQMFLLSVAAWMHGDDDETL